MHRTLLSDTLGLSMQYILKILIVNQQQKTSPGEKSSHVISGT